MPVTPEVRLVDSQSKSNYCHNNLSLISCPTPLNLILISVMNAQVRRSRHDIMITKLICNVIRFFSAESVNDTCLATMILFDQKNTSLTTPLFESCLHWTEYLRLGILAVDLKTDGYSPLTTYMCNCGALSLLLLTTRWNNQQWYEMLMKRKIDCLEWHDVSELTVTARMGTEGKWHFRIPSFV